MDVRDTGSGSKSHWTLYAHLPSLSGHTGVAAGAPGFVAPVPLPSGTQLSFPIPGLNSLGNFSEELQLGLRATMGSLRGGVEGRACDMTSSLGTMW